MSYSAFFSRLCCAALLAVALPPAAGAQDAPYASGGWPTLHADGRNSDAVAFEPPAALETRWTALDGAAVLTAVTIGPEGNLYATTGKAAGNANLHAFDGDGRLLWQRTEPDAGAVLSAPLVDADSAVYVGDLDQLWSFDAGGTLRWVVPLPAPLLSAVLSGAGHILGVTIDGEVMALRRDDGSAVVPSLSLGGSGPAAPALPAGLWQGLMDPAQIDDFAAIFFGYRFAVATTPAVDTARDRLFVASTDGKLYGIDLGEDGFEVAFTAALGAGSGASPALSPDGAQVLAADGAGQLYAFDATSGELRWQTGVGDTVGSPSVAADGSIYTLGDGAVHALSPDGAPLWQTDFAALAAGALPPVRLYGRDLQPAARANSVISVTPARLYVVVIAGYTLDLGGQSFLLPLRSALVTLDRASGAVTGAPVGLRDTSDAVVSLAQDGRVYVAHGALSTSIAYHSLNRLLPEALRVRQPVGGITALGVLTATTATIGAIARHVEAARNALRAHNTTAAVDSVAAAAAALAAASRDRSLPASAIATAESALRRATALLLAARQLQSSTRLPARLGDWLTRRVLAIADVSLAAALAALDA